MKFVCRQEPPLLLAGLAVHGLYWLPLAGAIFLVAPYLLGRVRRLRVAIRLRSHRTA